MEVLISATRHVRRLATSMLIVLACLSTILAACGGSSSTSTNSSTGNSTAACDKSTGLTLYSAQGYDSAAAKAFQQQTGIPVHLVDDSTGNLVAKVDAEKNNPQWDVVWFDGNATMESLNEQGYLLKWNSPALSNYTAEGTKNVPSNHAFYPTGITSAGVIVYNTKHVPAAGLPRTWSDLTKPAYKNLVAENDPSISGPAAQFVLGMAQILGGQTQAEQYFSKLKANNVAIFQTNDPTLNSVETGAREFAIVQDTVYYAARKTNQPLGLIYPADGVTAMPSDIAVSAHAKHQACAEQFVNWVLSANGGQKVMTNFDPTSGDTYFIPVIKGVTPVVTRQTTGINFVALDVTKWAPLENSIKAWFTANVVH